MPAYSFQDTNATYTGPGGNFSIGSNSGSSEEGISYAMDGDINTMTAGADGIMHSLRSVMPGTVTVRLLKTSPTNKKLQDCYNLQRITSALHGIGLITINNTGLGDTITLSQAAFQKTPDNQFAKDGNILEWTFQGVLAVSLGNGVLA